MHGCKRQSEASCKEGKKRCLLMEGENRIFLKFTALPVLISSFMADIFTLAWLPAPRHAAQTEQRLLVCQNSA